MMESISVLTFIKWRLTPSYVAKDTILWQKRPKTIVIRIIVWMTIFEKRLRKEGNMLGLPINNNQALLIPWVRPIQRQRSNWSPTYILHLFHLEDTSLLFLFISAWIWCQYLTPSFVINYQYDYGVYILWLTGQNILCSIKPHIDQVRV
jgi:hypothetical protein